MIIEFAGPPGSGKSTVNHAAIERLCGLGFRAMTAEEAGKLVFNRKAAANLPRRVRTILWHLLLAWHAILFAFEHTHLLRIVLASQWNRSTSWSIRLWILKRLFKLWGQTRIWRNFLVDDEIVLIDGGLLYFGAALFSSEKEVPLRESMTSYIRYLPKPDALVVIETPVEICIERVMGRERELPRRMQNLSNQLRGQYIKNQSKAVELACNEAHQNGWFLIKLNNQVPLKQVMVELRDSLPGLGDKFQ